MARRPRALSGGQRQRVALGRAIVRSPQAFLMDEPLSNLDAKLRVEMRAYIARLHQELGTTTLYVTHDQTEAMTMGDRVAVMRDGRLEQVDTPQRLYEQPANMFVAGLHRLAGDEPAARRSPMDDGVLLGDQRLRGADHVPRRRRRGRAARGALTGRVTDGDDVLSMPVVLSEMLGSDVLLHLDAPTSSALTADMLDAGDDLVEDASRFIARVPPNVPAGAGRASCGCASTSRACTCSTPRPSA